MSLFSWKKFTACFVDENGDYVGDIVFKRSWFSLGQFQKTFNYKEGKYNIIPYQSSRLEILTKFSLFDNFIYIYRIGNPDPISFKGGKFKPLMNAEVYKERLESKLIVELNRVASGGFKINWKYVLLALVGLLVVLYFVNGGSLNFGPAEAGAVTTATQNTVQNISNARIVAGGG